MTSPPLDSTDNWQRRVWYDITAIGQHTVELRRAWHDITALGQHTRSNDVGHGRREWHFITALGQHSRSNYVERGMTSPPLDSTHGRMKSGVACHHCLWEAQSDERHQAWQANITFGQHTRSNGVGRGMPASPLGSTWSKDVGQGMTSPSLDSAHGRTMSGVACHHHLWAAQTVERRRAWHAILL